MSAKARYRDPDIVALEAASGGLIDARTLVVSHARSLNAKYKFFETGEASPFERLRSMAKIIGFDVEATNINRNSSQDRDAAILMNGRTSGKRGVIVYDPRRTDGRILFSVAHEIAHTFFPNTSKGVRFRESLGEDSAEVSELERLCDLGASELLMPLEDFRSQVSTWTISSVPELAACFGASLEATIYRLASAFPGQAVAGLSRFRRCKADENKLRDRRQGLSLIPYFKPDCDMPEPKYRRQSFYSSDPSLIAGFIPWNKSFDSSSVIYKAGSLAAPACAYEMLPYGKSPLGIMEAVVAPYQRKGTDIENPDVLFYWRAT